MEGFCITGSRSAPSRALFALVALVVFLAIPQLTRAQETLPAPTNLTVAPLTKSKILLGWSDPTGGTARFIIEQAPSENGPWTQVKKAGKGKTWKGIRNRAVGPVWYRISAYNDLGTSPASEPVLLVSTNTLPEAPGNLQATAVSATQINLIWNDNSEDEDGFVVEMSSPSSETWDQVATLGPGVTSHSVNGLLPATQYTFRVSATNDAGNAASSDQSATTFAPSPTSVRNVAKGIFLLDNSHGTNRLSSVVLANKPFIDGFAWRVGWTMFDSGTDGPAYDFGTVAMAITNLQAMNKTLSITLDVQQVPDYVLRDAQETYVTTVPHFEYQITTCVPWDAAALVHYRNFLRALASYRVYDRVSGTMVPLRDHPTLGLIRAGVLGRAHVARDLQADLASIRSYTRDNYVGAVMDCLTAIQDQFPSKLIHIGFFEVRDNNQSPRLDAVLLDTFASEFDGVKRPQIGLFEELLTRDKPQVDGIYGQNLSTGRANGSSILFQALGAWNGHTFGEWGQGDNSPENGFDHGYHDFGAVYFEMYREDLYYAPFEHVFQAWHDFLQSLP